MKDYLSASFWEKVGATLFSAAIIALIAWLSVRPFVSELRRLGTANSVRVAYCDLKLDNLGTIGASQDGIVHITEVRTDGTGVLHLVSFGDQKPPKGSRYIRAWVESTRNLEHFAKLALLETQIKDDAVYLHCAVRSGEQIEMGVRVFLIYQ